MHIITTKLSCKNVWMWLWMFWQLLSIGDPGNAGCVIQSFALRCLTNAHQTEIGTLMIFVPWMFDHYHPKSIMIMIMKVGIRMFALDFIIITKHR